MGSMQWHLGREMGTIPAIASRTQENQENLCRDGRSQDLPDSGFQPAVRHLSQVVWCQIINIVQTQIHSTDNTNTDTQYRQYKHRYIVQTIQTQIQSTDNTNTDTQYRHYKHRYIVQTVQIQIHITDSTNTDTQYRQYKHRYIVQTVQIQIHITDSTNTDT